MGGRISKETIDKIRVSTDIVSLVGEYTRLEQKGNSWWGCCPFHGEKTASFHVEPDRNFYYCFGCHAAGDVIKFVMEQEKISYVDAIKNLAKRNNIEIIYEEGSALPDVKPSEDISLVKEVYNRIASTYHYLLTETDGGKPALDYILGRGLTMETVKKFKLGYSPENRNWLYGFLNKKNYSDEFLDKTGLFTKKNLKCSFFNNRLMFPIYDRHGDVVGFGGRLLNGDGPKYLNSSEMPHYKKREVLYAFNFAKNSIREKKTVIFCEGYMDVIAYHQCGIDNAVAPLGTALTEEQVKLIRGFADTVLLSFDSDGAGQTATEKAIYMCRRHDLTVKVIRLKGGKDPAEIMVNFGPESLTKAVQSAILDSDFLLNKLAESFPSDSAEDKTKAALAYFPYVDSLQSDMQKESSLDQLARTFNLKPEAVRKDFNNRDEARLRAQRKDSNPRDISAKDIKLNAELRAILAVISNLEQFKFMRNELTVNDFEDPLAKELFIVLEECFRKEDFSFSSILEQCANEDIQRTIISVIESGEFSKNYLQLVPESVQLIKKNSLERQRDRLMNRIRRFEAVTPDDEKLLTELLAEKMQLDKQLQSLSL